MLILPVILGPRREGVAALPVLLAVVVEAHVGVAVGKGGGGAPVLQQCNNRVTIV
jgi:hypothetical protein